jgi:predicted component of type VI protein secretion system
VNIVILIRAVSFRGRPVGRELVAQFAEAGGGTIGRGENNTLVLPDPERFISRTHITISFLSGGFVMTDNSTKNPVILNGRPLGPAGQARLKDGDEITLGGYTLEVTLVPATGSANQVPPAEVGVGRGSALPKADPLAAPGGSASKMPDPFADLLKPVEPATPRVEPALPWPEPPRPPIPRPAATDPLADLRGREPSIDELLLGLKPGSPELRRPEPPLGHPFPQADPAVDPFVALGWAAKPVSPSPTVPDHGPEVFTPYAPPVARLDPALQPLPEVASPPHSRALLRR